MPEKFEKGDIENSQPRESVADVMEWEGLLRVARKGVDKMSAQQRERLTEIGYSFLKLESKQYQAIKAFEAVQNFEGLRTLADTLLEEKPESYELPHILTLLEDYESIHKLLNRSDVRFLQLRCQEAFHPLTELLRKYIEKFLNENGTPIATGIINEGIDLVAIHNLSRKYDVAVPIARGGLNQGAIANLWGMPTKIVDIAAHRRKVPKGKWVTPISRKDFDGKDILLFDKDAITGATVRKAVEMLSEFSPASIGIYFAHNIIRQGTYGTRIENLPPGLEIFYPKNASLENAGDVYIETHEKLGTLYGRRRLMENLFIKESQKIKKKFPDLSKALKAFISKQLQVFDSLNPKLAGISEARELILLRANKIYQEHQDNLSNDMYAFPGTVDNFKKALATIKPLPPGFESGLIRARYRKQAEELAKERNVENPPYQIDPLAAFNAAQEAVKNKYDIALIVGPEGFSYEPYFRDLGMPTIAVNIPESGKDEPRTIKIFDNLSVLQDKKVLVIEDDVSTGATLKRLIEIVKPYSPQQLGLYLGLPESFQKISNIPREFKDSYIAESSDFSTSTAAEEFRKYLESRGLKIFKTTNI